MDLPAVAVDALDIIADSIAWREAEMLKKDAKP
jgi:hypothetical protein